MVLQICFDAALTVSENKDSPAARSTDSTGATKLSRRASSGMGAFGKTKAPVDISKRSGLVGDTGLDVNTTFAKWND